ncbi:ATP-dependent helicase rhp16 [Favolaschia claudopus]|uniref:ATP-dependent helicase rhp16 n=1 Tax=Favolaschia claudopus TaxID=2862362 RepID=A0AAW0E9I4_9AGAR
MSRRQSARLNPGSSPATTVSTANPSPAFSTVSSAANDTPPTSDDELPTAAMYVAEEDDVKIDESDNHAARKRGAQVSLRSRLGCSVGHTHPLQSSKPALKTKGKGKAALDVDEDAEIEESNFSKPAPKNKGKGKAAAMELDEEDVEIDESDDSGSEFVDSDSEDELSSDAYDEMEEEEDYDLMLQAATLESLQGPNVASSSSSRISGNPEALKRARAAEARLAAARRGASDVIDDSQMDIDDSDLSSMPDTDAEAPATGKGKKKVTVRSTPKKSMTMSQMREQKRKDRQAKRLERRENRVEEQALRKKLGRKLTYAEKSTIALHKHHPELRDVWGDLAASIPVVVPTKADQPANLKLTLLPFQRESLFWMKKQEAGIWNGGMLADEMGMGKTIQVIALFISDNIKPNLVVAPTVAIMQWKNEIAAHTEGLKVLVWHGSGRESNPDELSKYDVVLTTYSVLESSFRKQELGFKRKGHLVKEKSPLHKVHWNRIILDEAHNIKERSTNTAKAAFELKATARWCLSGTPLQNRVGELYSLVRFLGGDPFSFYFCKKCDCKSLHWKFTDKRSCDECGHSPMQHTCFWNNEILTPIQKHGMLGPGATAFKKLKILLDRMMLRRTKLQRADDLDLPPRTVIVRRDYFSAEEKELYLSLFSDAKRQFTTYLDEGTILNNYSNIFSLLTRMRQMACHPDLVLRSKTNATKFIPDDPNEATICRICNDIAEDAIQSKCRHIFDRQCIMQYLDAAIEHQPDCPVCHLPLTIDLDAPALELEQNLPNARQGILGRLNLDTWRSSSKIEALVEELSNLRLKDATTKSLVFSQFVNFLDLIAYRLQRAGFKICRLEGTMSPQARDATIKHFMENVEVTVFLVSLKAGGVALNLTEASRVYLMDSWWNPAVQAMDRIHRLGQRRPVKAIKLVVEDSIESRIVQLQEKKQDMVNATLSTDDSAMGRLTPEDLGFLFRVSSYSKQWLSCSLTVRPSCNKLSVSLHIAEKHPFLRFKRRVLPRVPSSRVYRIINNI